MKRCIATPSGVSDIVEDLSPAEQTAKQAEMDAWDAINLKDAKDILKDNLANYRWLQEVGGITWNGTFIRTDDRSKLLLAAIQTQIKNNNNQNNTRLVKTANGFVTMTDAQLEALYTDVVGHVQKCFDAEEATLVKIDDDTLTTKAAVEAEFDVQFAAL